MDTVRIQYSFKLPDGSKEVFNLEMNSEKLELSGEKSQNLPSWTNLDFHQCPHCPLTVESHPRCPLAVHLVDIVKPFSRLLSCDEIHVDVVTDERSFSQDTTAQIGISSLMGLVIATSGCPHAAFFRPMARFHLPLAIKEETIYRVTSMYLLAQYFLKKDGQKADLELEGLSQIYQDIHIVNTCIAERLRASSEKDSAVNAIVLLDMYALIMPHVIDKSLDSIRHMFEPFLMFPQP